MAPLPAPVPPEVVRAEAGVKWVRFARHLLVVLIAAVGVVGVVLTYLATSQARTLLEASLIRRAESAGRAAARAAFVPLMLEDAEALQTLVGGLLADEDLVFLRVEDAAGHVLAERTRSGAGPAPRAFTMAFPVRPPAAGAAAAPGAETPVGAVRLGLDRGDVDAEIRRVSARNLAVGAALIALVFTAAWFIVRGMIGRMEAMVGEVRLTEALRRSNEELESFAYVASHDLQEPLRMVASFTTLLGETYRGKLDAEADEYIAYAVNGATRMQQLIQDLLAYSRVRTQARPFTRLELAAPVAEAREDLRAAIEESAATLTITALPSVRGDRAQLRQLFQNLIGNAIKYRGDQPPRVAIDVHRDGARWVISVADNGIGIDPRYAERIFLPFQRLHTRREYPGTGIGLAIARKIVEHHGGRIWVESDGRTGSTFFFTLPASEGKGEGQ